MYEIPPGKAPQSSVIYDRSVGPYRSFRALSAGTSDSSLFFNVLDTAMERLKKRASRSARTSTIDGIP